MAVNGTGGQLLAHALKREGVEHLFTLCGGHVTPAYLAANELGIRVVDFRHEQAAAMAADGLARLTRQPQVALVTAGPGVTNAITAVANAHMADSPLVLIGGKSPFYNLEQGSLQEMEQLDLFTPITCWASSVFETRRIPEYVEMAFRHARAHRKPVFLEICTDLLYGFAEAEIAPAHEPLRGPGRVHADPAHIDAVAEVLATSKSPMVVAGSNVWWDGACSELVAFSEALHVPVFVNGMGRGTMPHDHELFFRLTRSNAMKAADAILLIGVPLDFRMAYGKKIGAETKLIRLERDGERLQHVRMPEFGLVGDASAVLSQLSEAVAERANPEARAAREQAVVDLRAVENERLAAQTQSGASSETPITHQRLCQELANVVDEDTVVIGDGGDIVGCGAKFLPVKNPAHWLDPGPFGCLGVGPSFAIAAKLHWPNKKVVLLSGDGAFGLNGFDLDTAVRHKLPMACIVGNDGGWGQIRNPQTQMFGDDCTFACDLPYSRYDRFMEALDGEGIRVEQPGEIAPALAKAMAAETVTVVDVVISRTSMAGSNYMRGL